MAPVAVAAGRQAGRPWAQLRTPWLEELWTQVLELARDGTLMFLWVMPLMGDQ